MKAIKKFIGIFLIAALTLSASFTTVFAAIPDENGIQSLTEHEKEHHGIHQIRYNGQVVGTLSDNVYGVYSQADNYAQISSVSISSFTCSLPCVPAVFYNNTSPYAFLYVYYGQTLIMKITYNLHNNGYLEETVTYN